MPQKNKDRLSRHIRVVPEYKIYCVSTNCEKPRKYKMPPEHDPRFIRPKKKPKIHEARYYLSV